MSTHEKLEHAEHAGHGGGHEGHGGGGFTMTIAMIMAIIAALLAVVTLLSHRSHNETIVCMAEANILHVRASDTWAFYQAKKIRASEYEAYLELLPMLAKEDDSNAAKARKKWQGQLEKYNGDGKDELKDIKAQAEELTRKANEKQEESLVVHHKSDRYDMGELLVEIALVLCSIAMLAKRKVFAVVAVVCAITGGGIASTGWTGAFMDHGGHAAEKHDSERQKPQEKHEEKHEEKPGEPK